MARGWESKAVADQIEEGNAVRPGAGRSRIRSSEEKAIDEKLASLALSKSRLLEQLERATNPIHRTGLLRGLKAIEAEVDQLNEK